MKDTKVILIVVTILVIAGAAGALFVFTKNNQQVEDPDRTTDAVQDDVEDGLPTFDDGEVDPEVESFSNALFELGTVDGIIPVEGFDAFILAGKIDGIDEQDFDGVESFEGIYTFTEDGLVYERTAGTDLVTSAEQTISQEGYATLLSNLKMKFGVNSVEEVLEQLDT